VVVWLFAPYAAWVGFASVPNASIFALTWQPWSVPIVARPHR
jgi:tryptophan-rich sensory protein